MDRGDLVPDKVTIAMVRDRLAEDDARGRLPARRLPQKRGSGRDPATRCSRSGGRGSTWSWSSWSTTTRWSGGWPAGAPAARAVASGMSSSRGRRRDGTGATPAAAQLFQRDDDKEETVRHRLEVYQEQTAPPVSYYADEGILVGVDATGPVERSPSGPWRPSALPGLADGRLRRVARISVPPRGYCGESGSHSPLYTRGCHTCSRRTGMESRSRRRAAPDKMRAAGLVVGRTLDLLKALRSSRG